MAFDSPSKAKGNDALVKAVHALIAEASTKPHWPELLKEVHQMLSARAAGLVARQREPGARLRSAGHSQR